MKYIHPSHVTLVSEKQECNTKAHPRAKWEKQAHACYRPYLAQHSAVTTANTFTVEVPNQPTTGWKVHAVVREGAIVEAPFQVREEPVRLLMSNASLAGLMAQGPLENKELSFAHFADSAECELVILSALKAEERVDYQDVIFFKDLQDAHDGLLFTVLGDRTPRVVYKSPLDGSMTAQVEIDPDALLVNQRCAVNETVLREFKARMLRTDSKVPNQVFSWNEATEKLPLLSAQNLQDWLQLMKKYNMGFQAPKVHDTRIKPFLESIPNSFFQHLPTLPEDWCEQLSQRSRDKIHEDIRKLEWAFTQAQANFDLKLGFSIFRKGRQLYVQILNSHRIALSPIEVVSESQALYVLEQLLNYFELGIKVANTASGYVVKAIPPALN